MTNQDLVASEQRLRDAMEAVRRLSDEYVRQFGRRPDAFLDGPQCTPRQDLIEQCKVVESRGVIIARLPKGGRIAEIGTLYGDWAVKLLDVLRPEELHIFDLSFHHVRPENRTLLERAGVIWHKGCSWEEMAKTPVDFFDIVYVDADHSFEAVTKDLREALRITKPGGYILCNDYTAWSNLQLIPYGVYAAVNAFANQHGLPFEYLALQTNGYYDVALRKIPIS
jgi:predicted O-methyltransferase YrrM